MERTSSKLYDYFHWAGVGFILALLLLSYFNIVTVSSSFILGSVIVIGLISIVVAVTYKIQMKQYFEKTQAIILKFKYPKLEWQSFFFGGMSIFVGLSRESSIQLLIICIGIYLILYQVIDAIFHLIYKTNILALTEEKLYNMNGRLREIKYLNIKSCERGEDNLVIKESKQSYKIKAKDFVNSDKALDIVQSKIDSHLESSTDTITGHLVE